MDGQTEGHGRMNIEMRFKTKKEEIYVKNGFYCIIPMYAQIESREVCKCLRQALARILTSLQAKKSSLLHIQGPMIDFTSFAAPCKRQNYVHTF